MHDDFRFRERRLDGLAGFEDFADFFEGPTTRLHEEEVDEDEFEYVPEDEQEVVLGVGVSRWVRWGMGRGDEPSIQHLRRRCR